MTDTSTSNACSWLKLSQLEPVRVLDETDGPSLFTARDVDGQLLLAYKCGEDRTAEQFLLVPTSNRIVEAIENDVLTLRDALTQQALMCRVTRLNDGTIEPPIGVDFETLSVSELPTPDIYLNPQPTLLCVRLIGTELGPNRTPASVVRRAVDGATGAVKTLIRHVLDVRQDSGRPTEWIRRYYDLPATSFAFRSFEVSFGMPGQPTQQDLTDDNQVLADVSRLLSNGLEWASAAQGTEAPRTPEWAAIVEAVSHLTPPQKGVVETVEVSGRLASRSDRPCEVVTLTREASARIGFARKQLATSNPSEVTYDGLVREFDKDQLTFWLRDQNGADILHVTVTPDQYDDALLAFETERPVTIFAYRASASKRDADLVSIAFRGS